MPRIILQRLFPMGTHKGFRDQTGTFFSDPERRSQWPFGLGLEENGNSFAFFWGDGWCLPIERVPKSGFSGSSFDLLSTGQFDSGSGTFHKISSFQLPPLSRNPLPHVCDGIFLYEHLNPEKAAGIVNTYIPNIKNVMVRSISERKDSSSRPYPLPNRSFESWILL